MGLYVADSAVKRVLEGENSDVGYITTDKNAIFPEASEEDYSFSYTGADQHWTAPFSGKLTIECKGAGSNNANGGYAKGTILVTKGQKFSIMVGGNGGRTNDGTTYGFGGSTTYGGRGGGGLSGVFTGDTAIGANDASRVVIIAGGAGGGRTGGGAGGGENGQNGNGGSYGYPGAGGTQTGRGNGGNTRSEQFRGGGGSGTYGFGGGGGWRGGNGSGGDGSGDDDAQAGGGSGHCSSKMTQTTLTVGGGAGANTDGSISFHLESKIIIPTPTKVTSAGAYHNSELGLISISTDGENWTTISDKNVGATSNDPTDTDSYGDIFQYGNIYHFDGEGSGGTVTTEAQIPDLTGYEGGNLYSNDKYRTNIDWNAANKKLWKPVAFANLLSLQKGPCDKGFHVPSAEEWTAVLNAILELEGEEAEFSYDLIARYLLMAHPNARKGDGDFYSSNTSIYFTNSYIANQNKINAFVMIGDEGDESGGLSATDMNCGGYIRGFRDVAMIPTTEWEQIGGGGSTVRLPLAYQEVEYIESTGTQYIDTGYIITPNTKTEADFQFVSTAQGAHLDGIDSDNATTSGAGRGWYLGDSNSNFKFVLGNGVGQNDNRGNVVLAKDTNRHIFYADNGKMIIYNINGAQQGSKTSTRTITQNAVHSMYLFGRYEVSTGGANRLSSGKMYSYKIWNNNVLQRDFVPCYRRIDGVIGMYDLVNDQFYTNAGTGTFSKGDDVNAPELPYSYTEVEYLQSNGGQYIDTGIDKNEILTPFIRYEFYSDTSSTDCGFLGYRGNGTGGYIFGESQNQYRFTGGGTAGWQSSGISYSTGKHTFRTNSSNWYLDGTQGSGNGGNMNIYYGTLHLFRAGGGFNVPNGNIRVYSCLVGSSNDSLIHYYIPCFRNSDSKPGLYDLITKEFLVNDGTGEFTRGNALKYYKKNSHTISFFPFEANTNDVTGNRTVTFSGPSIQDGSLNIPNSASYGTLNSVVNNSVLTISCLYYYGGDATDGKWNTLFAHAGGTYHHILFPAHTDSGTIGNIGFYNSGWNPSSKTLTKNKWYHIVTTKNGTNQKIYVNGVLVQNATSFNNATSGCELGMICNYNSGQKQGPIGKMKEVVFENIEWNLDRIQELYNMYKQDFNLD